MLSPDIDYRIKSGSFAGFEALKIVTNDDSVVVTIDILGRPTNVEFPLDSIDEHLEPFGDDPPQEQIDHPEERLKRLRLDHADVEAIFATDAFAAGSIQLSHSQPSTRLIVQTAITTEVTTHEMRSVSIGYIPPQDAWQQLLALVDESNFWSLPYDDGRRYPKRLQARYFHLEGWDGSNYHCVKRYTLDNECPIQRPCEFLKSVVSSSQNVTQDQGDSDFSPKDDTL